MNVAKKVLVAILVVIVLGLTIPALWSTYESTSTGMGNLSDTTAGTFVETTWPIGMLLVAIAIGVGVLIWAIRRFRVLGRGR